MNHEDIKAEQDKMLRNRLGGSLFVLIGTVTFFTLTWKSHSQQDLHVLQGKDGRVYKVSDSQYRKIREKQERERLIKLEKMKLKRMGYVEASDYNRLRKSRNPNDYYNHPDIRRGGYPRREGY